MRSLEFFLSGSRKGGSLVDAPGGVLRVDSSPKRLGTLLLCPEREGRRVAPFPASEKSASRFSQHPPRITRSGGVERFSPLYGEPLGRGHSDMESGERGRGKMEAPSGNSVTQFTRKKREIDNYKSYLLWGVGEGESKILFSSLLFPEDITIQNSVQVQGTICSILKSSFKNTECPQVRKRSVHTYYKNSVGY